MNTDCLAVGCLQPVRRNGLCVMHAGRWRSALIRGLVQRSLMSLWLYEACLLHRDVADALGVSASMVRFYACGISRPGPERFPLLAAKLGRSQKDLDKHFRDQGAIIAARELAFRSNPPFPLRHS